MRWEAKHSQFTSIKWKNFKNLPMSMAYKHQKWLCSQMLSPTGLPSENYLYEGDTVHGGNEKFLEELLPSHRQTILQKFPDIESIFHAEQAIIHGNVFKCGCVLILGYDEEHFPILGWLSDIYVHEHRKFFMCHNITITDVLTETNAYEVEIDQTQRLLPYQELLVKMPLSVHLYKNRACVCDKYGHQSIAK